MSIQPRFIQANGLEFGLLEAGPADGELLLLAHGFPDSAWSFAPIMRPLADAGYRVVAPFMRGYLPTQIPADGDYRLQTLARDLIALVDELGASRAVLVGHDWGAVATYTAAALRPDRVRAVVCAAIPHLRRFLLRPTPAQLRRSSYMLRFQLPDSERHLAADDFAALRALAQSWSPGADLTATLAPVIGGFSERARLSAALGYYRAIPKALFSREGWPLWTVPTPVPACVIHGAQDGCIGAEIFGSDAHLFAAGVQQICFENAGHFMQVEQPARFAEAVLSFVRGLKN
ncbi:MAG: alpha/beta hydrolase [Pseudomonadota bacterium]